MCLKFAGWKSRGRPGSFVIYDPTGEIVGGVSTTSKKLCRHCGADITKIVHDVRVLDVFKTFPKEVEWARDFSIRCPFCRCQSELIIPTHGQALEIRCADGKKCGASMTRRVDSPEKNFPRALRSLVDSWMDA